MDTTDILFICGGSFPGLEGMIENRLIKSGIIEPPLQVIFY